MAGKKRIKKKHKKSKIAARRKAAQKRLSGPTVTPKKKSAKKKIAAKRARVKAKAGGKRTAAKKTAGARRKKVRRKGRSAETVEFSLGRRRARADEQSGDLQGLSNARTADSESVDQLLEEGNALEAEVVKGVEDAEDAEGGEVRTHEVPEDDVPGEYLDEE